MARPITLFTIQWGDLSLEEVCNSEDHLFYFVCRSAVGFIG